MPSFSSVGSTQFIHSNRSIRAPLLQRSLSLATLLCLVTLLTAGCAIATVTASSTATTALANATTGAHASPTAFTCPANAYCAAIPGPRCDTGGGSWSTAGATDQTTTCGPSSLLVGVNPSKIGTVGFEPPSHSYAPSYTAAMTEDFSNAPDICAGFDHLSDQGIFTALVCPNGAWVLTAQPFGKSLQSLGQGSVSQASSYRITVTYSGTRQAIAINGTEVGSTTSWPISSTTLLALAIFNNGSSSETVALSDFVYTAS